MLSLNQKVFLSLVQAGLWEKNVLLAPYGSVNYEDIYRLAQEQSIVGLVAAGLEKGTDVKVPQRIALTIAGEMLQLEQHNRAMNAFVGELIDKLRKKDVYTLLVKGQGIAQCYERPLWRVCGDVDLFLSDENYQKAVHVLSPLATKVEEENSYRKHLAMTIDGWSVELHGTLRSGLWNRLDREIDNVQNEVFLGGAVRSWTNGNTQVLLPRADEDVVFVFSHILQHFFKEGIGLRQICDWCRILWTYRKSLNVSLLEKRLCDMGMLTEWKTFGAMAVEYLGMPDVAMPLYSDKYKTKGERVLKFVLETGNFGRNRHLTETFKYPTLVRKLISFFRHTWDGFRYLKIFPLDAIKIWMKMVQTGLHVMLKGA